ncbi:BnaA03g18560D [Brassica napus]|uniref:BnaA03g18560D protein n=1 Tax=Brassica napus TaxID=3708 RepID=A0A078EZX1_BRANA|nr:BnaA03g18560D [Brassica napus]
MEVGSEWLKALGASLISDSNGDMLLDTKVSLLLNLPLIAHGERYLDVNDFFYSYMMKTLMFVCTQVGKKECNSAKMKFITCCDLQETNVDK